MPKEVVSIEITPISFFTDHVNLKVEKINNDGTREEIFMDPVKIGDGVRLEDISLKE